MTSVFLPLYCPLYELIKTSIPRLKYAPQFLLFLHRFTKTPAMGDATNPHSWFGVIWYGLARNTHACCSSVDTDSTWSITFNIGPFMNEMNKILLSSFYRKGNCFFFMSTRYSDTFGPLIAYLAFLLILPAWFPTFADMTPPFFLAVKWPQSNSGWKMLALIPVSLLAIPLFRRFLRYWALVLPF